MPDRHALATLPPAGGAFPTTCHSLVTSAASADGAERERAVGALAEAYWRPVYEYIRRRWGVPREDAEDLTQGFFADAIERGLLGRYDPARARFRTYLRRCVHGWVANEWKSAGRLKRGGAVRFVPMDTVAFEDELMAASWRDEADEDAAFREELARSVFALAVDALRARCEAERKAGYFALFERYDVRDPGDAGRPTYAALAAELGLTVAQVTNHLALARRWFREIVLQTLRALSGSDEEYREMAREIFGVTDR